VSVRIGLDYRPALINREGIGRYTRELVRALGELGGESAHDEFALFAWTLAAARVSPAELGLARDRAHLARLRFPSRWIPRLCSVLGRGADDLAGGADLWHHTQPSSLPVRAAVQVATVFDCIYLRDEGFLSRAAAETMTRSVRALADASRIVLVPSAFVADDVERHFGVARERLAVTHLGCDHVLRHVPAGGFEPAREPFVLTVSRVDPRKNHLGVLAAFERLVAAGCPHRWIVAGPPGHRAEEFEEALARSPARARVEWRRFASERELAQLYSQCSAFLFPSFDEGFGLPPLEALACGAPVVAGRSGSLPEVLGDAADLVDPRDTDALFEKTRALLEDRDLARARSLTGREHARRFTWRACAQATRAAYVRALAGPG
jgi:glycosyltransferase involved in cell wall biosynthesis